MASTSRDGKREGVEFIREDDGSVTARDLETGLARGGETRAEALENLDEAVALHRGEIGRPPTDDELREMGIDPEANTTGNQKPPDVLD